MKKIINIILITLNLLFAFEPANKYWGSNKNFSPSMNNINSDHYFSILSSSSNGSLGTFGIYGNSTNFTLNNRTQLYSNVNIIKSMESGNSYVDDWNYTASLGMKYQLNDRTSLSIAISIMKTNLNNMYSYKQIPLNQYNNLP